MTTVSREELLDRCWSTLVEMTDRTSPEEYPDMCLITREELSGFLRLAAEPADDGALHVWMARNEAGTIDPHTAWKREPPTTVKNRRANDGWKIVLVEIRALSTKAKP